MSDFVNFLHEVFIDFGPIRSRKMFGGHGIYHQDLMFGLVADDVLYLKVDAENREAFEALDLEPFTYNKNGKDFAMSYYRMPEECYDDPTEAARWAKLAFDAAVRGYKPKKK